MKNQIIDAYCKIREIDNTIPDVVLDTMKESALEMIEIKEYLLSLKTDIDSNLEALSRKNKESVGYRILRGQTDILIQIVIRLEKIIK